MTMSASSERGFATGLGAVVVALLATLAAIVIAGFLALTLGNMQGALLVLGGAVLFALGALFYVTLALEDALEALHRAGIPVRRRGVLGLTRTEPGPTHVVPAPAPVPVPAVETGPFGHVHAVIDVEGIGPGRATRLKDLGIETTKDLWFADAAGVAAALKVGVPMVRQWQQMSELMAINGIGKQFSELLVRSGVGGIEDLASRDAADLLKRTEAAGEDLTHRIQGAPVNRDLVASWIQAARDHAPTREKFMSAGPPWAAKPPA